MKKEVIIYAVSAAVIGAIVAGVTASYAVNSKNQPLMSAFGINSSHAKAHDTAQPQHAMAHDMSKELKGKTGDDFDKAFLDLMIKHHKDAVRMAELAKLHAGRSEIKQLGTDIITAQSSEIKIMHGWEHDWGFKAPHNTTH